MTRKRSIGSFVFSKHRAFLHSVANIYAIRVRSKRKFENRKLLVFSTYLYGFESAQYRSGGPPASSRGSLNVRPYTRTISTGRRAFTPNARSTVTAAAEVGFSHRSRGV